VVVVVIRILGGAGSRRRSSRRRRAGVWGIAAVDAQKQYKDESGWCE
jgi:hypothetical protein